MQTWITDYNLLQSARNLDTKRLQAQIYEAIHILASLLNINDKLVNPKRSVKNHPVAKLWEGWENALLKYIQEHVFAWVAKSNKSFDYIRNTINWRNMHFLLNEMLNRGVWNEYPDWITNELIITHRSVLIQKKPDYYRKLWPNVPDNLKMRYNWKK